ncbi:uncharacterized protein LOC109859331 [Pseudomyrmex gracilis]|uniref:uncharacterized protein LOC109859331 n=1 Tax=Pseudomyrmex gracilis TaxID=219809 RepID=UPI0009950B1A|nr:uncharacterized protein LOC109859331 [Pseudomyrmex gracilis]
MDVEKDGLHKSSSPERRLRLKKSYKERDIDEKACASDDSNIDNRKNRTASTSQSGYDDDSILDFKSPKKHPLQPRIIDSYKPPNKSKKKLPHSKSKVNKERKAESSKLLQNKKIVHDVQQPSIESSFFKSDKKETNLPQSLANVKIAHVCPLCFKTLKDENSQAVHMKSCATKNNVSTKKLMVAVELQERQAAERKSLGLLSAPVLQEKKKPVPRKMTSHDDPDLQLALALSKSLYEKEEMENWDEAQIAAISSSPSSLPNAEYCHKTTLQNFGFTSNRNVSPVNSWPATKIKKKKITEPTILQRRTAVERESILTERIAEILMGCKDFTQRPQEEEDHDVKEKIVIKNQFLQQIYQTENTLWDKTKLTPTKNLFYVKQLLPQIAPSEKQVQISNEEENIRKLTDPTVNDKRLLDQQEEKIEIQTLQKPDNEKLTNFSSSVQTCCREKKFLDDLASSWRNILNDSSASDIIVFVRDGKHIWTHKLVFYVRCTNILLDVVANDTEFSAAKEKLCWTDVDYDVALAFFEFVYCGIIEKYSKTLDSDTSLSDIRSLARKYKVHNMFAYLRQREFTPNPAEIKHERDDTSEIIQRPQETLLQENSITNLLSVEDTQYSCFVQHDKVVSTKLSEEKHSRTSAFSNFERTASPDMFDDTSDTTKLDDKSVVCSKDYENSNLHMLLSLIKQDADIDICSQIPLSKSRNTGSVEPDEDESICVKNIEQDVMEIDSDSHESFTQNTRKSSSIDTPQRFESKSASDTAKRKGDITLFIEKIQRENARSDSNLDIEHSVLSPLRYKNPFLIDRHTQDSQSYNDNTEQSPGKKKLGRLSKIEQCMRSYADKHPEFYSRFSNKIIKRNISSLETDVSPERTIDKNMSNRVRVSTSPAKDVDTSRETIAIAARSSYTETTNQSFNTTVYDLEEDNEDISMYSKYMRNHKDNSIAKYRAAIVKSASVSDLSHKSTSTDLIYKTSYIDETENRKMQTQSTLSEKDTEVIVSSDTEIESVSSSCPVVLQNDDRDYEDVLSSSVFDRTKENKEEDTVSEKNSQLSESEQIAKVITTDLERQGDVNNATKSSEDELNGSDTEMTSDDTDFGMIFTQKQSKLNEQDDNQKAESVPSPIIVPSSPDASNIESLLSDTEHCSPSIPTDSPKLRESLDFSLPNFEDDIYIANVDVNQYEKHSLEKSRSAGVLNVTKFKKNNAHRKNNNAITDSVPSTCENLNSAAMSLTQNNVASIRNLRKKSLSEGQISMNRLCNQGISKHISVQICSDQNIAKPASKIIEKDVTPPPDYNDMQTPELHKKMKKYGLKAQKRGRAVKLLMHIYNELHPLIPDTTAQKEITEISSDEDDGPPVKKRNVNNPEKTNNVDDTSDNELLCSQESNGSLNSAKGAISKEMEFYETESLPPQENSSDIAEAFTRLIDSDQDLYNKILRYEPVNIESLHCTLRTRGFKCKLSNLMSFLDEQCITFYAPEQNVKGRTRKR